jgi:hypothetical protein
MYLSYAGNIWREPDSSDLQWYKNQGPVGTGASVSFSSTSSFELKLVVTDDDGFWGQRNVFVEVSSEADDCPW